MNVDLELDGIINMVQKIAKARLRDDPGCPGGEVAKLHSVVVDIGLRTGELMAKGNLKKTRIAHHKRRTWRSLVGTKPEPWFAFERASKVGINLK